MQTANKVERFPLTNLIEIDYQIPLVIRRNKRAKRIYLRYNPTDYEFSLTLPQRTRVSEGMNFVRDKRDWIAETLRQMPRKKTLRPGIVIPVLGDKCRIRRDDALPSIFALAHGELHVRGNTDNMPLRIQDSLKKIVRNEITELAEYKASQIRRRVNRITLRDTSSRWGSCSSDKNLMFSWRLVFAPYEVLDYVVAHEVAHLKHMDHSPAFWRTVEELCPDYELWKDWLKYHGKELFRFCI